MPSVIISDTSSLIVFQNINELELLHRVYGTLLITPEVANEFIDTLPEWIKIVKVKDKRFQQVLETQLGKGEASSIALAMEINDSLLLLDDLKARKMAAKLNLRVTGVFGVLTKAKV